MSTLMKNILALFGFLAAAVIAAFLAVVAGNTPNTERGVQSATIESPAHELGWEKLVSIPIPITLAGKQIGMWEIGFQSPHNRNGSGTAYLPDMAPFVYPKSLNSWAIGDEVFVVYTTKSVGKVRTSTTFFVTDRRKGTTNTVATK